MGLILSRINALAARWMHRSEQIDEILDVAFSDLQELAELVETLQQDAETGKQILETLKKRQDEFGAKIRQLDESISKAKKGFWGRLIFGG